MSDFNYIEQALRTKSDQFHGELVTKVDFADAMQMAIIALARLDQIKKALFYGKPATQNYRSQDRCTNLPYLIDTDILHCALGCATEAGEMLEQVAGVLFEGKSFDAVNFKEEIFDQQWYHAIGCNALGATVTFESGQRNNIDKLKARFPEKFDTHKANNRDLETERKVLEE